MNFLLTKYETQNHSTKRKIRNSQKVFPCKQATTLIKIRMKVFDIKISYKKKIANGKINFNNNKHNINLIKK